MLKDSKQRAQATDPERSFIVQAPAGSGKTEILTQRFLRLLSRVKTPEQIVALTFTRKAASEMRERILVALQQVAAGIEATSAHQQQTYRYAADALNHSKKQGWQLLEQPGRLRIITLDSLCQMINQAIPLQEKQIPYAQTTEKPLAHYQAAARACLAYAIETKPLQSAIKCILEHLDNRQDKVINLLCQLLANRDQWLGYLYSAKTQDKEHYEEMLSLIEQHELARLQQSLTFRAFNQLRELACQVACIEANPKSPRFALCDWNETKRLDRTIAAGLAALLLTSEDKLRKSFDHHIGLKRGSCDDNLYDHLKAASKTLLANLEESPDFLDALIQSKNLPSPRYDADQWMVLQALFTLLPILVGHLHLEFSKKNEVDFSAVSQQALAALGDDEHPTDLTLYLDNSIHHLLIDEFQDTSIQQFHLITRLVQGWQPDDGRTLFIVGDPMQSIYRFRQAEVGLFLKARQQGIGSIPLNNLELCCNFRSTATVVDWVNQQFKTIFPQTDDIASGAISFHASVNVQETNEASFVKAWQFKTRRLEAQAIVKLVAEELENNPDDDLAILVRSRNQLTDIISLLREQGIPFQGVDIELLSQLPHLRDIWSLTQALILPANRLAWLALLRSPYCGLTLADLHLIANFSPKKSILYALSQSERIQNLSTEGRLRAQFIYTVLNNALACRHQHSLIDWIANTLRFLHNEKILTKDQQDDLEQFWLLLDKYTNAGQLPDLQEFKQEFDKLYSQRVRPSRLQIMTIHKSKGLEFDSVILPGLSSKSQNKDQPLLRWLKLPSEHSGELLLVSPLKAAYREECLLYNYLAKLDAEKDRYELQRLFYVAATRAKKRLYLFDSSDKENKGTFRSFLTGQAFLTTAAEDLEPSIDEPLAQNRNEFLLSRLPTEFYLNNPVFSPQQNTQAVFFNVDNLPRHLGIIAHELLQWICDNHPQTLTELPWNRVDNHFKSLGFSPDEREKTSSLLREQLTRLFNDPVGQWLCKAHKDERNEYELLINQNGKISTRIIDRTFIDQGQRWIIDFKTGSEDEEAIVKHRQQVNDYAKLLAHNSQELIRCGLYYLSTAKWVQWDYQIIEHCISSA